jgi:hypothetical protein
VPAPTGERRICTGEPAARGAVVHLALMRTLRMRTFALVRAVLLAVLPLLAACASQTSQRSPTASVPAGNADELAASALFALVVNRDPQQALTSIERASQIAPSRPELAWLHAQVCMQARGCEPEPIEARLRKLDPGNGIAWLGPLARAQARNEGPVEQQILEAMSHAERFDLYWTSLVWRLTAARNAGMPAPTQPGQPLTATLDSTIQSLSMVVPAFKPLSTACSQQRTGEAAALARCQRIAQAMQRSDTTLVEGLGLGMGQRLATPGSPDAIVLDERVAVLAYRNEAAGSIVSAQVERDKFSAQMLELMKKLPHEQDVSVAILRWAGRPLAPPR